MALLLLSLLVALSSAKFTPQDDVIPGQYVVVFKDLNNAMSTLSALHPAVSLLRTNPVVIEKFVASFVSTNASGLAWLQSQRSVKYVEPNIRVYASQSCYTQQDATWGIDRIDHKEPILTGEFDYTNRGEGITAYIIDTGIRVTHLEFEGRATWGTNTIDKDNTDGNGHGTHVAGTVGGKLYGVAKKVQLVAVKVLSAQGSGTMQSVLEGVEWVVQQHKTKNTKAVANLSLGGMASKAENDACDAAVRSGVLLVVAAGNEKADACTRSPASASLALTVGATTLAAGQGDNQYDALASYSNWGTCVKVLAPGTLITSAWSTSDTAIHTISGTSMATPHVAGVAAAIWSASPSSSNSQITSRIVADGLPNLVTLNCGTNAKCKATPNKLLHMASCADGK